MIKAVLFDFGGVLIKEPSSQMLAYYAKKIHVKLEAFLEVLSHYAVDWSKGKFSEKEFWKKITTDLSVPMPQEKSLWLDGFLHAYQENEQVFSLVKQLKKNGTVIALFSNTEIPIMRYVEKYPLDGFDFFFCSCGIGMLKPNPDIYSYVIEKLKLAPNEILFIDDKKENIAAAKVAGMHGIVFTNADSLEQQLHDLNLSL